MKKNYFITVFIFLVFIIMGSLSSASAQTTGSEYCQQPSFLSQTVQPNALFVVDVSGSMVWNAYDYGGATYDAGIAYEGYFDPTKHYKLDTTTNVWEETTPTGLPCTCSCATWRCRNRNYGGCVRWAYGCSGGSSWGCCTSYTCTGDCNVDSGNRLNFDHMRRIDLLRWAITGGKPSSCDGSNTFNTGYCDPEMWDQVSGSGKVNTVCNNNIDINDTGTTKGGCILLADDGTKVASPWIRVNAGLAIKLKELALYPRMGVMFYHDNHVLSQKVYIGDFLASNNNDANYPYMNFITHINSPDPSGSTPTGPAMLDALNYFDQTPPQYGGFTEQSGSGDHWRNPIYVCDGGGGTNCTIAPCANNFVVLMSDGQWNTPSCSIGSNPSCTSNSSDPAVAAYCMHHGFTNAATGTSQRITAVYTVGLFLGGTGEDALKNVAMYGSFNNSVKTWPSNLTGYPNSTCTMDDCGSGRGSACTTLPTSSSDWDSNADGVPDTFFKATNALEIREKMTDVILDLLRRATSGTAASILASSEGSGANLVQAIFYPKHVFGTNDEISWTGTLRNFWYYLDPLNTDNSYIREDTVTDSELVLDEDYIVSIYFDTVDQKTRVARWSDDDGSGNSYTAQTTLDIEDVASLWEGGMKLWSTTPGSRTIWTNCAINAGACINPTGLMNFTQNNFNSATLRTFLQSASANETEAIVRYIRGEDTPFSPAISGFTPTYRDRTVTISGSSNVWKLGDIVNSTPKIVSFSASNQYHTLYKDYTYNRYINTNAYKRRGNVFVGANDGMLHAFKLGLLGQVNDGTTTKAILCNDADNDGQCDLPGEIDAANLAQLGQEQWAFIPKNSIPYLRYLTDPDYCHLYYVDMPPVVFDASINMDTTLPGQIAACTNATYTDYWNCMKSVNSWRSILIGGMRMGGGCKGTTYSGSYGVNVPVSDIGYSSYFALDITDPLNPILLWEFPDPARTDLHHETVIDANGNSNLGFSMSGPAIVKINAREVSGGISAPMVNRNGRWFVVFASGPTGPIDTSAHQFKGFSDKPLRLFVLDLRTGELLSTIDTSDVTDPLRGNPGITNAFGGSLIGSTVDYDLDYQDNAVYLGFTQSESAIPSGTTRWLNGGVIRLLTREDLKGTNLTTTGDTALNPANWVWSYVAKEVGPVTASVTKLVNYPSGSTIPTEARLYFGTGRYYYNAGAAIDDATGQRYLFGVKEPCLNKILSIDELSDPICDGANLSCAGGTAGDLATSMVAWTPQCITEALTSAGTTDPDGWYIMLDASSSTLFAEREITDPQAVGYLGTVFFTTFAPSTDICGFGGSTYVWAVDWDSGGAVDLEGKALLQVSTGAIETLDLSSAFIGRGNRRTAAIKGVPPFGSGIALVIPPKPTKNILDIRKK